MLPGMQRRGRNGLSHLGGFSSGSVFLPGSTDSDTDVSQPWAAARGAGESRACGQGATRCFPQPSVPEALNPAGELGPKRARHGLRELGNATELMIFNIRIMKPS